MKRVEIPNVKIDPIVVDMPPLRAEFVRFETGPTGQQLFVVYEIKST